MTSWSIGNKEVDTLMINGKIVQSILRVRDNKMLYELNNSYDYIITNQTEFADIVLNNPSNCSILLKEGTYNITSASNLTNVLLVGEEGAKIVNTNTNLRINDTIIDGIILETSYGVNASVIYMNTGYNVIRNCTGISESKPWDGRVIDMNTNNQNGLQEIYDCYFYGNAASRGYGHTCSAIIGQGNPVYNVLIHHNTFNHPCNSSQLLGGNKGKAIGFYSGNNASNTYYNVHLYCNTYQGCGDTNIGRTEETCPD